VGGQAREASYVRLTGLGTELVLPLAEGQGASFGVRVPSWSRARSRPPTGGPASGPARPVRPRDCVPATVADGALRVDLSRFSDRTSDRGFALVPAAGAAPALDPNAGTFRLSLDPGDTP
jgi:hypothetical protein